MKRDKIKIALILALSAGLIMQSCTESTREDNEADSGNILLFEDLDLLKNVSNNPLDNHTYRIELLGSNEEAEEIAARIEEEGLDLEKLNLQGIEKSYLNNSRIIVYSVPYNASEKLLVIYRFENMYQINMAEFTVDSEMNTRFQLSTLDGRLYYGIDVDSENRIEGIEHHENETMNSFNDEVYFSEKDNHREMQLKTKDPTCCRRMSSYDGCLTCTIDYFEDTAIGKIAFGAIGRAFFVAIGVSCIGAGPSAVC